MRIALGGISHETNTYATASTGTTGLDRFTVAQGDAIFATFSGTGTSAGGVILAAQAAGIDVVPTLFARAEPSGTIERAAYEELKHRLLAGLADCLPIDAVALDLHGAGVVEGIDDLEGDLGSAIRALVGPDVPIGAVLDLHGNATPAMAAVYDVLLGCHLYPHTDLDERGEELVGLLSRTVRGEIKPVVRIEQIPMLMPTATTDGDSAAARANAHLAQLESRPGILDCTLMHGFPFTDVPDVGSGIIAIADASHDRAAALAREAAVWVWERREQFRQENDTPESAVRRALTVDSPPGRPLVINECSDNPGGGSPGDGTHLLRAMVEAGLSDACFAFLADPEVVQAAAAAGVGARLDVKLGGKHDEMHGRPIPLAGCQVRCLTDGRLVLRAMLAGVVIPVGPTCRLTAGGIDIVVSSHPFQTIDPEIFLMHGIDVTRYRVVGLKSSNHFRAGFAHLASEIVTADSLGLTTNRVELFDHGRATRPLWPTDPGAAYPLQG